MTSSRHLPGNPRDYACHCSCHRGLLDFCSCAGSWEERSVLDRLRIEKRRREDARRNRRILGLMIGAGFAGVLPDSLQDIFDSVVGRDG